MNLDKDLLNYLMTSDFTEDMTHDYLKDLLKSFRFYYRYQYSKMLSFEDKIGKLEQKVDNLTEKLEIAHREFAKNRDELMYHKNRRLTFMERIKGKITK